MSSLVKIDATGVWCPNYTTPVMSLIKKHIKKGESGVVITKEPRSINRMAHLCASFEWNIIEQKKIDDTYIYLVSV
jgi:TusA-related sulfurtransferase